tara:strand:+ start:644 stop:808 length:165 start_codon:yes stop_codon:yes gene_type:complete
MIKTADMELEVKIKVDIDHYPDPDELVRLAKDAIDEYNFKSKILYKDIDITKYE